MVTTTSQVDKQAMKASHDDGIQPSPRSVKILTNADCGLKESGVREVEGTTGNSNASELNVKQHTVGTSDHEFQRQSSVRRQRDSSFSCRRWRRLKGEPPPKVPSASLRPATTQERVTLQEQPPHWSTRSMQGLVTTFPSSSSAAQLNQQPQSLRWKEIDYFNTQVMKQLVDKAYGITPQLSDPKQQLQWQNLPPHGPKRRESERKLVRDHVYLPSVHKTMQLLDQVKSSPATSPRRQRVPTTSPSPLGTNLLSTQLEALQEQLLQQHQSQQQPDKREPPLFWSPQPPPSRSQAKPSTVRPQHHRAPTRPCPGRAEKVTVSDISGEDTERELNSMAEFSLSSIASTLSSGAEGDDELWATRAVWGAGAEDGSSSRATSWCSLETHVMQALEDPVKLVEVDKQNEIEGEVLDYDKDDVSLLKAGISSDSEQADVHDLSSCSSNETMGSAVASESVDLLNDRASEEADLEPIVSTFLVVDKLNSTSIEAPGHEDTPKNENSVLGDSDAISHGEESERATEESEFADRSIVESVEVVENTLTTGGPSFEVAAVKDIQDVDTEDTGLATRQSFPTEEQEQLLPSESGHVMGTVLNAEDAQDIDDESAATGVIDPADQGITSKPQETPSGNELTDAVEATELSSTESNAESEEDAPVDTSYPTIELLKSVETGSVSAPETTDITPADLVEETTTTEVLHSEGDGATQGQLSSVDLASASLDEDLPQLTELLLAAVPALQERSNSTKIELVHYPTLKQLELPAEVDDDNDNYATDFEDNDHREDDTDDSQGYESFDDE